MLRKSLLLFLLIGQAAFGQEPFDLASASFNEGNFKQALTFSNQSLEDNDDPSSYLLRAMIHQSLGNNSNAHEDYVQAITLDREYYEAYFQFSEFLVETMEYERAIASLNFLLNRIDRGDTKGIFVKYDVHRQEVTQITTLVGMEADILSKRGLALQKLGQLEEAILDFDKAIEISETVDKLVNRALLLTELGKEDEAKNDLTQAINLNPGSALAWYNLLIIDPSIILPTELDKNPEFAPMLSVKGIEAFDSGDYLSAGNLFDQALKLTPNDPVLLLNSGRLDQRNEAYQSARVKFTKAINLAPSKSETLYLLGNSYFGQKEYRNAISYYQQYLKTDPTHAQTWFNSGMAYLELKELENACKCLNRSDDLGMSRTAPFLSEYCTTE
ncbi:MAG: tetratricopeptide repeat protein [Cytophagales bacterium]|nr:tetratricopeptide repeat protein [Cytophagales bacterium]